ncbi:hypothetical protein JG688_00018392 [Phytophthora aleatoria]|uniref:Peptidase S74 domain-containing protein n=1 Tax=Phytophthora aleatoria TaxID=2496075 RepID=A0A8J5IFJ8_9STRA|nr:hypothetical protein JG688_00018392 [Phytophthora aleatoria]
MSNNASRVHVHASGNVSISSSANDTHKLYVDGTLNATTFYQAAAGPFDLSLIPRLSLTTLGVSEVSKAIVLDSTRSCSNIYGMTFDAAGTGLNTPALSFGGTVFNQNYYISLTEGSAGISKALINTTTSSSSATTGTIRCAGGGYFGGNCIFNTALTATDIYGLIRTPAQPNISSVGTLTSLSTSGNITFGGILKGFLGYGNQSKLGIGSTAATTEYLRITGNGLDYLDGSYTRFMRFVGSNSTPVRLVIEASNGTSATASNAVFIGTSTPNDLRFGTNNNSTMSLTTTNRLGVGTLSPTCGLQVTMNTSVTLDASGSGISYFLRTGGLITTLGPITGVAMAIQATGAVIASAGFYATSDARRKNFFHTLDKSKIMAGLLVATPKLYRFKSQAESVPLNIGYSAQELIKNSMAGVISYVPKESLVIEDPSVDVLGTEFNVDYSRMSCYIHIGLLELNNKVVSLTSQLAAANAKITDHEARLKKLEAKLLTNLI